MRTLTKLLGIGAFTLASLAGCKNTEPYYKKNVAKYDGYDVRIYSGRMIIGNLKDDNDVGRGFKEYLSVWFDSEGKLILKSGIEIYSEDELVLRDLAKRFVNPEKLAEIYNEVKGGSE